MKSFRQDHCRLYCSKTREWQDETKKEKTTRAPLAGLKGDGKWRGSLFVCFPLFLEGLHLTTEHPPLATCQKGTQAWLIGRNQARQGVAVRALQGFFPIKSCLRVTGTCHPWPPPHWWIKTFQLRSIWKLERDFRKVMSIVTLPSRTLGQATLGLCNLVSIFCCIRGPLWSGEWREVKRSERQMVRTCAGVGEGYVWVTRLVWWRQWYLK